MICEFNDGREMRIERYGKRKRECDLERGQKTGSSKRPL